MSIEELKIDEEFASLIPPLTKEEYQRLEQSITTEGCRDSIVLWEDTIIDGHNRYKICKAHNIDFQTTQKSFTSRDKAILWVIRNQLGRRNLNAFRRIEMVHNYHNIVKAQAKERQGTRTDLEEHSGNISGMLNTSSGDARDELGKMAGVSGKTYEHAVKVIDEASPFILEAAQNNTITINTAYELTKLHEEEQNGALKRIENGESPNKVISEFKTRVQQTKRETTEETAEDANIQSAFEEISPLDRAKNTHYRYDATSTIEQNSDNDHSSDSEPPRTNIEDSSTPQFSQRPHTLCMPPYYVNNQEHKVYENTDESEEEQQYYDNYNDCGNYFQDEQEEDSSAIDILKTKKLYKIIYAAPTWKDEQSPEELCKLQVRGVTDNDCALFLWIDSAKMPETLKVIEQWGFTYQTVVFVWLKMTEDNEGKIKIYSNKTSDWTYENCKLCLLATQGKVMCADTRTMQCICLRTDGYDRIPDKFKELTVQLLGNLPALELFPKTDSIGNEECQFSTYYNNESVEWDMAAPQWFLEQIAEERCLERNRDALGL